MSRNESPSETSRPATEVAAAFGSNPLVSEARKWLGVPYKYGGNDRNGVDCSGFLVCVFRDGAGLALPRTTRQQHDFCVPVKAADLRPGDILFYSSPASSGKTAHVGLYIGNGRMIHSSSSRGVVEDDINTRYYTTHYRGAGRHPENTLTTRDKRP